MRRRTIYSSNGKIPNLNAGISLDKGVGEKLNAILRLRKSLTALESQTIFEKTLTALESKIQKRFSIILFIVVLKGNK